MPAVSKAQQKFMSMVHAAQKGDLKHPSAAVRKAASSMSKSDAKDFASTKRGGLPDHVDEVQSVLEAVARYNEYGEALRRATTMQEVAEKLARIAEMAEQAVVSEADDWFDSHTLKRNMKEIKSYAGDFSKLAQEADTINQRMTALYEDMGRILERYFEIQDAQEPEEAEETTRQAIDAAAAKQREEPHPTHVAPPVHQECAGDGKDELLTEPDPHKLDELTLRAIKAVHENLKRNNPQMAGRFAKLKPHKMREVVWRMVK